MLVLETICHETIWGGSRLTLLSGTQCTKIGHLYSVFCREGISNRILNGPDRGKTLNDVFSSWKSRVGMEEYPYFPLTISLTSADENLSIQVHPDDEMASSIEKQAKGKRESWYFLETPATGWIINGCTCRDNLEKNQLLSEKRYLELADKLYVKAGDYVFVQPGTLHAITAGSLVYEIEEGADFTYRFYDYDRVDASGKPRELQVKKAAQALNMEQKSTCKRYPLSGEIVEETYITEKLSQLPGYTNHYSTLVCLTLIKGGFLCDGISVRPGMTVLIWPGESIVEANIQLAFAARLRRK